MPGCTGVAGARPVATRAAALAGAVVGAVSQLMEAVGSGTVGTERERDARMVRGWWWAVGDVGVRLMLLRWMREGSELLLAQRLQHVSWLEGRRSERLGLP